MKSAAYGAPKHVSFFCLSKAGTKKQESGMTTMKLFTKERLSDAVIFSGMAVNAVIVALILYYFVF
jgi:hypothetical protein